MIFSFPKKYQSFAVLLSLFAAMGGIVWLGMFPLERSVQNTMRAIEEFHAGRENRERQVGRLPELQGQYEAILANEQALDILITEDEVVDFVKTVERLAKNQNIILSITSKDGGKVSEPKKVVAKPKAADGENTDLADEKALTKEAPASIMSTLPYDRYLSLSIKAEGSYRDVVAFLDKLETLPLGLDVVGMEVKKKESEPETGSSRPLNPSNPFAILGDATEISVQQPLPEVPIQGEDTLEAVFDLLVYVKKTGV